MQNRTTKKKRLITPPSHLLRNKEYYFNTLDIEHDLLKKASDLAERMMVAFMRENRVEVSVNVDDMVDKIIAKMGNKMMFTTPNGSNSLPNKVVDDFSYDDGPVIIKTEKIEVKGKIGSVSKTGDSISENMEQLEDLNI